MRSHEEDDGLMAISSLMLDFLASKSLVASERALRRELHLLLHSKESSRDPKAAWKKIVCDHNVYTSELEKQLNITVPLTTRRVCSINHLQYTAVRKSRRAAVCWLRVRGWVWD